MPFSNPIIGGGGALIRDSIQSPDYVAGTTGWAIKRDGSAEFNDVAIRGSLNTGAAGVDHIFIPNNSAEVDFVLATGSTAKAITSTGGTGVAGIDLESGPYISSTFPASQQRAVLQLRGSASQGRIHVGFPQEPALTQFGGPELDLNEQLGQAALSAFRNSAGQLPGGVLVLQNLPGGFVLKDNGLGGFTENGFESDGAGVYTTGNKFLTDPNMAATFTPAANWTLNSAELDVWGPFCVLNVSVNRSAGALPAGVQAAAVAVGTLSFGAGTTAFPKVQTPCSGVNGAGVLNAGDATFSPAGNLSLIALRAAMAVGNDIRFSIPYFRA